MENLDAARIQIQAGQKQQHTQAALDGTVADAAKAVVAMAQERHQHQLDATHLRNDLAFQQEKAEASALKNAQTVSDAQRSALTAQQASAEALHHARDVADAERRRLMLQLDEQHTTAKQTVDGLRAEILSLTNRVETVRQLSEDANIALVREQVLHEATRLAISGEREQWPLQRVEMTSPEAKSQSILQLMMMMHRSLGLLMYRWLCPGAGCERRVAVLYGANALACRHCHQLAYKSQRQAPDDRAYKRADKLRARLGWGFGVIHWPGGKPKGMHWRTFWRLHARYDASVIQAVGGANAEIGKVMKGLKHIERKK